LYLQILNKLCNLPIVEGKSARGNRTNAAHVAETATMVGRKRKEKPNNQRPTCRESARKKKTGGSITRAARLNRF
jgi:hypothetical protein